MGEQTLEVTIAGLRADVRRIATDSWEVGKAAAEVIRRDAVAAIQREAAVRMDRIEEAGSRHAVTRASAIIMTSAVVLAASAAVAAVEWTRWHYVGSVSLLAGLVGASASVAVVGASFMVGHLIAGIWRS
jgi:predicted phage tail protein